LAAFDVAPEDNRSHSIKQHSPRHAAYLLSPAPLAQYVVFGHLFAKTRKIMKTETSDMDASVHPAADASLDANRVGVRY